jgi:hypothetical protein
MPKNEVSDLITDQEIAFVHLIVSGITDQRAAEAVGLDPTTAAYIKSKPCARAYMLEHRALMQQQLVQQEADPSRLAVEGSRLHVGREQVLDRLWELASLGPDMTRGSITGQVKAMSMIVAIEGLIPDRRAGSAEKNSAPPTTKANIYQSEWLREQQAKAAGAQSNPALDREDQEDQEDQEDHQEDGFDVPHAEPDPFGPGEFTVANRLSLSETQSPPDTRVPFSIPKNPFARRR